MWDIILQILNGLAVANAAASALLSDNMINSAANMDIGTADQFCGRFFNANAAVGDLTVCCKYSAGQLRRDAGT